MAKGLGKRRRLTEVGSALAIPSNAFSDINTMLGRRIGELS